MPCLIKLGYFSYQRSINRACSFGSAIKFEFWLKKYPCLINKGISYNWNIIVLILFLNHFMKLSHWCIKRKYIYLTISLQKLTPNWCYEKMWEQRRSHIKRKKNSELFLFWIIKLALHWLVTLPTLGAKYHGHLIARWSVRV